MRILLDVSYKGTCYAGWQRQKNALSVQQLLEEAMEKAFHCTFSIVGASRTDAGVHAQGQRAVFNTELNVPAEKYPFIFNSLLPEDVRVNFAQEVPEIFHPRFCAEWKRYMYRIYNARHASALYGDLTAHVPLALNEKKMEEAALLFVGTHDFSAFAAAGGSAKTTVRTIHSVSVKKQNDLITFTVTGNAFLYNMVRIMAGTLIYIGLEKLPMEAISRAFATGNRVELGVTAPAKGLELTYVAYDKKWNLMT